MVALYLLASLIGLQCSRYDGRALRRQDKASIAMGTSPICADVLLPLLTSPHYTPVTAELWDATVRAGKLGAPLGSTSDPFQVVRVVQQRALAAAKVLPPATVIRPFPPTKIKGILTQAFYAMCRARATDHERGVKGLARVK